MAVRWRRERGQDPDPESVLVEARRALGELRDVLRDFRANLDALESEIRQPSEEGGVGDAGN